MLDCKLFVVFPDFLWLVSNHLVHGVHLLEECIDGQKWGVRWSQWEELWTEAIIGEEWGHMGRCMLGVVVGELHHSQTSTQLSCWVLLKQQRYYSKRAFIHSMHSSISGCWSDDRHACTCSSVNMACQKSAVNCTPRSDATRYSNPWSQNTWAMNNWVIAHAVGRPGHGIKWVIFVSMSTTTKIIVTPFDGGSLVMKSNETIPYGPPGMGSSFKRLGGRAPVAYLSC